MSDPSGKVIRGGCMTAVAGGVLGSILCGLLGSLLFPPKPTPILGLDLTPLAVAAWGTIGFLVGAVIGGILGARRAGAEAAKQTNETYEAELARLRQRVHELEVRATQDELVKLHEAIAELESMANKNAVQRKDAKP